MTRRPYFTNSGNVIRTSLPERMVVHMIPIWAPRLEPIAVPSAAARSGIPLNPPAAEAKARVIGMLLRTFAARAERSLALGSPGVSPPRGGADRRLPSLCGPEPRSSRSP